MQNETNDDDAIVWVQIGPVAAGIFAMTNAANFRALNDNPERSRAFAPGQVREETPKEGSARENGPASDGRQHKPANGE